MGNIRCELKSEDLEVITAMNEVYFGEKGGLGSGPGRGDAGVGGWSRYQAEFAADYFLKLLDGSFIDSYSQLERRIKADAPQEWVIHQALSAFTDFTYSGCDFLYHEDPNIPNEVMRTITLKLIKKIEGTTFTVRQCAEDALSIITGMKNEEVLKTAKNTWLEDHWSPPRVPYDADVTNRLLIPEAIQYAKKNISFIR